MSWDPTVLAYRIPPRRMTNGPQGILYFLRPAQASRTPALPSKAEAQDPQIRPALTQYELPFILNDMKVGERGQVTIPKEIREQFGLGPETEVEFHVVAGSITLKKAPRKLNLAKWKGRCGDTFAKLGYSSVDRFLDDVRGR